MTSNNRLSEKFDKLAIGNRDRLKDGIFQTKRTKLHENREKINEKINKDLRMKSGAKNLIELTKDKRTKSKINIEIDFFESNLKLWKEELERANCALDTYQDLKSNLPMIPIAMKNTIDIDFKNSFRNILENHYGEDPDKYNDAIETINSKRKAIQYPRRSNEGINDHISYYNLFNNIEKRLFFQDRSNGIIFSWNDVFTGVPFQQRTVVFEKSGVIFNLAALYSQLAAGTNKTTQVGLEESQNYFLNSEACLNHLLNNFVNPPSVDMKPEMLQMLSNLMKVQAMECKFLLLIKVKMFEDKFSNLRALELVGESFAISILFENVYSNLNIELLQYLDHIPHAWINLVQVKSNYYKALAYKKLANRFIDLYMSNDINVEETIEDLSAELKQLIKPTKYHLQLPSNKTEALGLSKLLINEALPLIEESIKLGAMNKHLRNLNDLANFLNNEHKSWIDQLHSLNKYESYDLLSCPELQIEARHGVSNPGLFTQIISQKPEADPFKSLGPIETFNSRMKIGPARIVVIIRDQKLGFGFTVKGQGPMKVINVEKNSNAEKSGLKVGDVVLSMDDFDLRWSSQDVLVQMTTRCSLIKLTVTTVIEMGLSRNYTFSSSAPFDLNKSSQPDSLSLSLPNRKVGKLSWKQRLSGTLKKKSSKTSQPQTVSTLF